MKYEEVLKNLPSVIAGLNQVTITYNTDAKHIGTAIGYLTMLRDVLKEQSGSQPYEYTKYGIRVPKTSPLEQS